MDWKVIALAGVLCTQAFAVEKYEWGNVRFDGGGFVSAVMFHPKEKNLLYARTDVGGIYRYDFSSKTWIPLMDFISENDKGLYGTEAFALDPTDPKRIYVLAGTSYFSKGRTAVLRSEDYGSTWDTSYVEILAHGNGMGRQTGEKLAVDPNKTNILFCGSRTKGLYKSTDYGKTWANAYEVAISDATGDGLNGVNGISFVMFDESQGKNSDGSTKTIYMGISEKSKSNLQVSNDGGATWKAVAGSPEDLMPHRAKIVGDDMYITYADGPGPYNIAKGAVYKYNIKSGDWTDITPSDDGEKNACPYGGIAIDPKDSKRIVVSTLGQYTGRHVTKENKENYGDRIYVTTDGGKSWTHGQHYEDVPNIDPNGTVWIAGNAIHWAGSLEINPFNNKEAWVTSGNGIFQTDDITAKVPLWKFQSKGIEETVPLDIVSIPGGPLVTAIGDYDGAIYTDINKSTPRHTPIIGTTESMGYASLSGSLLRTGVITDYSGNSPIDYYVMYRSDDTGKTWDSLKTELNGKKGLVVLSADGKVILHRPDQSVNVYRSDDNGATWTTLTTGEQTQYARIVADPKNADVFYVMSSMGTLYKSTDKGKNFTAQTARLQNESAGKYYNGGGLIRTVPGKEGHLWVPMDQAQVWQPKGFSEYGLAYTEDGGKTWNNCEGASTAIAVGIGKAKEGASYETIYIWGANKSGSVIGIYRSTDKCKTFERVNDDAHQFGGPGNGNFVQGDMNNFGVVYMSTVGRGLIVGAPEGTKFVIPSPENTVTTDSSKTKDSDTKDSSKDKDSKDGKKSDGIVRVELSAAVSMQQENRTLYVNAPAGSKLTVLSVNGHVAMQAVVGKGSAVSLSKLPMGRYIVQLESPTGLKLGQRGVMIR